MNDNRIPSESLWNSTNFTILLFFIHTIVVFCVIVFNHPWFNGDTKEYILLAESIGSGKFGTLTPDGFQIEGLRLPGFPVVIFLYEIFFGKHYLGLVILQEIFYLFSVFLTWRILQKHFKPIIGFIFLIILIPYPFIAYSSSFLMTEVWCVFFLTAAVYLLVNYYQSPRFTAALILAAVLLGISFYFRPNLFPLSVSLALAIVINNRGHWKKAVFFLAISWAVFLPFAAYNYSTFNKFSPMPVGSYTGVSLWQATWQNRVSIESFTAFASDGITNNEIENSGMLAEFRQINEKTQTELSQKSYPETFKRVEFQMTLNKHAEARALENIKNDPASYLLSSIKNMARMWFATYNQSFDFRNFYIAGFNLMRLVITLPGIIMLILGAIGCIYANLKFFSQKGRFFSILYTVCLLNFTLTMCWLHTESRYTIPVRLFLVASAAIACYFIFDFMKKRIFPEQIN